MPKTAARPATRRAIAQPFKLGNGKLTGRSALCSTNSYSAVPWANVELIPQATRGVSPLAGALTNERIVISSCAFRTVAKYSSDK